MKKKEIKVFVYEVQTWLQGRGRCKRHGCTIMLWVPPSCWVDGWILKQVVWVIDTITGLSRSIASGSCSTAPFSELEIWVECCSCCRRTSNHPSSWPRSIHGILGGCSTINAVVALYVPQQQQQRLKYMWHYI